MVELAPAARSPITPMLPDAVVAGWVVSGRRSSAALTLTDHTPLAKVVVKAAWDGAMAKTLAVPFGRSARQAWNVEEGTVGVLLTGSGPGEWLALAAPGQQLNVVEWFEKSAGRAAELVTVVDLTHGRALVRLTGQR
ncbi:MAG: hypothetical protein ABJA81_08540, partial [Nocardioidaceae bacterium]